MQALFAPESTTRSIRASPPQRLVDSAALQPPYDKPLNRRSSNFAGLQGLAKGSAIQPDARVARALRVAHTGNQLCLRPALPVTNS
jgi:hypothetical protein